MFLANYGESRPKFELKDRLEKATEQYVEMLLQKSERAKQLTEGEYHTICAELRAIETYKTQEDVEAEQAESIAKLAGVFAGLSR